MKNSICGLMLGLLISSPSWAIDTSNKENMENLRDMLFAEGTQVGKFITQTGKTTTGEDCYLHISLSQYGASLSLFTKKIPGVGFRASISGKTSSHYEILDSDENLIEIRQIALSMDERGNYANKQHLRMITNERPGEPNFNNVAEISLSNQLTQDWIESSNGHETPDFSESPAPQVLTCTF